VGRLDGKTALISGSARGQGEAHARLFAEEGARVLVSDLLDDQGEAVAQDLSDQGFDVRYRHLDVRRPSDWEQAVAFVEREFGTLDILINNAGIVALDDAVNTTDEVWNDIVATNQTGVFNGMRAAVPAMRRAGGGSIVNISSSYGLVAGPDFLAYQASKRAVVAMTESAAATYASEEIRVNCICPGLVMTPMSEAATPEQLEVLISAIPLGRPAQPREISYGALFLSSDEGAYVTGSTLAIDGAMTVNAHKIGSE
jgi:NAD(P)-dependent dehydrogenase (short-subunit alcohol dehydrogenase family)